MAGPAVSDVRCVVDGVPGAPVSVESASPSRHVERGRRVDDLVDLAVAVLIDTRWVALLLGPWVHPEHSVVTVPISVGEAVTVCIDDGSTLHVSRAALGDSVAAELGRAGMGSRIVIVAVRTAVPRVDVAIMVAVVGLAFLVAPVAVLIGIIRADRRESRPDRRVAVVAVDHLQGGWVEVGDSVVVDVLLEATFIDATVAIVVQTIAAEVITAPEAEPLSPIDDATLQRARMDVGVFVVAVVTARFGQGTQRAITIVIARNVPIFATLEVDGAVLIDSVSADLGCAPMDLGVVVVAIVDPRESITVMVLTGSVATVTVDVVTIGAAIVNERIPELVLE